MNDFLIALIIFLFLVYLIILNHKKTIITERKSKAKKVKNTYNEKETLRNSIIEEKENITRQHNVLFKNTLIKIASGAMLADKKATKVELNNVKEYFVKYFGEIAAKEYLNQLQTELKNEYNSNSIYKNINDNFDHFSKIQMLHLIIGIVSADHIMHDAEMNFVLSFANNTNINIKTVESILAMYSYVKEEPKEKTKSQQTNYKKVKTNNSNYTVLEINSNSSIIDIKKAYRRLAILHHPDKSHHLGEDFQLAAKQKFQKIKAAYEKIKKEKGF